MKKSMSATTIIAAGAMTALAGAAQADRGVEPGWRADTEQTASSVGRKQSLPGSFQTAGNSSSNSSSNTSSNSSSNTNSNSSSNTNSNSSSNSSDDDDEYDD